MKILLTLTLVVYILFFCSAVDVLGRDKYSSLSFIQKTYAAILLPAVFCIPFFILGYGFVWIWSL